MSITYSGTPSLLHHLCSTFLKEEDVMKKASEGVKKYQEILENAGDSDGEHPGTWSRRSVTSDSSVAKWSAMSRYNQVVSTAP